MVFAICRDLYKSMAICEIENPITGIKIKKDSISKVFEYGSQIRALWSNIQVSLLVR